MAVKHTRRSPLGATPRSTAKAEIEILKRVARGIDSPRSLMVYMLAESGQIDDLVSIEINPDHYLDPSSFRDDYLVSKLVSKSISLVTTFDKKVAARKKFDEAQARCAKTNDSLLSSRYSNSRPFDFMKVLHRAKHHCRSILGTLDSRALKQIECGMAFGPGATTQHSGVVTAGRKFSTEVLDVTPGLLHYGVFCLPELWKTVVTGFNIRDHSKEAFVPKNAKTDRLIRIEPTLNIFVQKGIGAYMKKRLAMFGLDLSTQEWNRYLAGVAVDWNLTTLDLESASDTVSIEIVNELIPEEWRDLLSMCRTPSSDTDVFEMWSSMGNGYTFELESLIFYSLALAVIDCFGSKGDEKLIAVYGDDIIVPSSLEQKMVHYLDLCGFKVNERKSFGKGAFRESCGSDYFMSMEVRPVYLRFDQYGKEIDSLYYLYGNLIRDWSSRSSCGHFSDVRFLPAWLYCVTAVPKSRRCYVPYWDYATGGFVVEYESIETAGSYYSDRVGRIRCRSRFAEPGRLTNGFNGYAFFVREHKPLKRTISEKGAMIAALLKGGSQFSKGKEPLRGRFLAAAASIH